MNKNLLTLAGLLSLLVVNQAFGWPLTIKNETAKQQDLNVRWSGRYKFDNMETVSIPAGETKQLESAKKQRDESAFGGRMIEGRMLIRHLLKIQLLTPVGPGKWRSEGADENFFIGNPGSHYQKGLTIKTGSDGKPIMVENQ